MTTEEIIAEAKKRYPIGTKYKNAVNPDESVYIMKGDDFIPWINDFHKERCQSVTEQNSPGIVHSEGVWAEIISVPDGLVNNFPIH
jgi:hypothetical protein